VLIIGELGGLLVLKHDQMFSFEHQLINLYHTILLKK